MFPVCGGRPGNPVFPENCAAERRACSNEKTSSESDRFIAAYTVSVIPGAYRRADVLREDGPGLGSAAQRSARQPFLGGDFNLRVGLHSSDHEFPSLLR